MHWHACLFSSRGCSSRDLFTKFGAHLMWYVYVVLVCRQHHPTIRHTLCANGRSLTNNLLLLHLLVHHIKHFFALICIIVHNDIKLYSSLHLHVDLIYVPWGEKDMATCQSLQVTPIQRIAVYFRSVFGYQSHLQQQQEMNHRLLRCFMYQFTQYCYLWRGFDHYTT